MDKKPTLSEIFRAASTAAYTSQGAYGSAEGHAASRLTASVLAAIADIYHRYERGEHDDQPT